MKQLFVVLSLFIFSLSIVNAQESVADFRFTPALNDCNGSEVCFDIQVRANQANQQDGTIELADVNYRFFYPNNIMTFAYAQGLVAGYFNVNIDEAGPLGDEILDLFGPAFDGTDGLGFADLTMQVDGNSNAVTLTNDWLSTVEVCFTPVIPISNTVRRGGLIVAQDFCTNIVWSIPEYNGAVNYYRFAYLTATEVEDGNGSGVEELTEEVFHFEWTEANPNLPDPCELPICRPFMPVELIDFMIMQKDENQTQLHWSTASEINSESFIIERRSNYEEAFQAIQTVSAAGFSDQILTYKLNDQLPKEGEIFYYRLKILDLDGTFEYSDVKSVSRNLRGEGLKLFPNPASESITFSFDVKKEQANAEIFIYDYSGKQTLIQRQLSNLGQGIHQEEISLNQLPNGYYIFKIIVEGKTEAHSFQIQK